MEKKPTKTLLTKATGWSLKQSPSGSGADLGDFDSDSDLGFATPVVPTAPRHGRTEEGNLFEGTEASTEAWEEPVEKDPTHLTEEGKAQVYLTECPYYIWAHGKMLFIHRAETIIQDKQKSPQPLDQTLSIHEVTRSYHLERDIEQVSVSPNDDRYIILRLKCGLTFRWRIDGDVSSWIEDLRRQAPQSSLEVADFHIRDILHCWQPHMQGDGSSCFFYTLQALPHMANNVYLETVTGIASPAVMWYSHGGATVSFALLPQTKAQAPPVKGEGLLIEMPGEVPDSSGLGGVINRPVNMLGEVAPIHIVGAYVSDLTSLRRETREGIGPHESMSRYCLELIFTDGTRFRLCYSSRFMRLSCQQSLTRLRLILDPAATEVNTKAASAKQTSMQSSMQAMGLSLANAQDRPASKSPATPQGWQGLSGAMEVKILSASKLGLTEEQEEWPEGALPLSEGLLKQRSSGSVHSEASTAAMGWGGSLQSAARIEADKKEEVKQKQALPCPRVCAYFATQPPPNRIEVRKTPDLPERTANPIWNSTWFFTVEYSAEDPAPADIRLEIWNVDGRNDFLGEVKVPFPLEDGVTQHHLDLIKNPLKMKEAHKYVNGNVSFQVSFKCLKEIKEITQDLPPQPDLLTGLLNETRLTRVHHSQMKSICGTLGIEVVRAIGLRSADLVTSDPYCSILVGSAPRQLSFWKSTAKMGTLNPVWREIHEFQINWPKDELEFAPEVKIEVWDFDSVSADEFLGEISIPLPYGDGENFIDLEVQPNRSKSPNTVKGCLQVRIFFKNQFSDGGSSEDNLDNYEQAFCSYFGTRVVDDQFARLIAPIFCFLHLGWRRLLLSQFQDAWRRATFDLLAFKEARGAKSRAQCYLELSSSLVFAVFVASVLYAIDPFSDVQLSAVVCSFIVAMVVPSPGNALANFVWHRPEPPALVGRDGLGGRGPGPPGGLDEIAQLGSFFGLAWFVALAEQELVDKLWLATAVVVLARLVFFPLFRGLRMTLVLQLAKGSKMYDWLLRRYPSIMTAHGALLQRLPSRLLAPPA